MSLLANVDVAVIGAGISGLSAAHNLQLFNNNTASGNPVSYAVIEALDRIGGKTLTLPAFNNSSYPVVDEGAAYISDDSHTMMTWLGERFGINSIDTWTLGLDITETSEGSDTSLSGAFTDDPIKLAELGGLWVWVDDHADDVDLYNITATPDALRLDNLTLEDFFEEYPLYTEWLHEIMIGYVWAVLAVNLDEVSALFWLQYTKSNINSQFLASGAQAQHPDRGSQSYARGMANELEPHSIYLSSPVKSIGYSNTSGVHTITTKQGDFFTAKYVIVSVPSTLYDSIEFDPPLSNEKKGPRKDGVHGKSQQGCLHLEYSMVA
ncbi:hypothetical protein G7054_g11352 [Neopestalotiopsis clavispora]|nr:hypothetical protein G7054_g11352 [Neopestalotiopsis clavispora]